MKISIKSGCQLIAAIILSGNLSAQSIQISAVAGIKDKTTTVPLTFVAGGGVTNFDFKVNYDPALVDENAITVECHPEKVGLTELNCAVDTANNQVKGIGVNLSETELTSGFVATITFPVLGDAADGESVNSLTGNFADGGDSVPLKSSWKLGVGIDYCAVKMVSNTSENADAVYEACEILVAGPDLTVEEGASVKMSSGWDIWLLPGFSVEKGATLDADVCGQSLCQTSKNPMPLGCHSCVDKICEIDSSCCETGFSQACQDMVETVCGLICD